MNNTQNIKNNPKNILEVCGSKESPHGHLKLTVSSKAPVINPEGWKDLWKLSPFSVIPEGISVPGMNNIKSKTVENAWQFLKIWKDEEKWNKMEASEAFKSDCAIRFPRGRNPKVLGHYWQETEQILDYITARVKIYLPLYKQLLALTDRQILISKLKESVKNQSISIWDFDSYSYKEYGLSTIYDTIFYTKLPFAHSFILAIVVNGKELEFQDYLKNKGVDI
ncbi:DUF6939 family protein [Candidatus Neomarinimicrobiota bacterium]